MPVFGCSPRRHRTDEGCDDGSPRPASEDRSVPDVHRLDIGRRLRVIDDTPGLPVGLRPLVCSTNAWTVDRQSLALRRSFAPAVVIAFAANGSQRLADLFPICCGLLTFLLAAIKFDEKGRVAGAAVSRGAGMDSARHCAGARPVNAAWFPRPRLGEKGRRGLAPACRVETVRIAGSAKPTQLKLVAKFNVPPRQELTGGYPWITKP